MLRIKTTIDSNNRIITLIFGGKWITMATINGELSSLEAASLLEAGQNHLSFCKKLRG